MSRAIAAHHGEFGRACLYEMDRPLAMHAHREGHLLFHLDGQAPRFTVANQALRADRARAVAVSPLQPHDMRLDEPSLAVRLLVLYVDPDWFQAVEGGGDTGLYFGRNELQVTPDIQADVSGILAQLTRSDCPVARRGSVLDELMHALTRRCHDQSWQACATAPGRPCRRARDARIRRALQLMKESLADDPNLDQIASGAGLSRPHFYRLFRENLGITPNVYLNTLRMEMAIDRLIRTDQAVTSIGLDLGFASQASFTRFFGANVGIPPTDYRRAAHCS